MLRRSMITIVLLLAIPPLAFGQIAGGSLIVPGKGIGSITIGMTLKEAQAILGTPAKSSTGGDIHSYTWVDLPVGDTGFFVIVRGDHVIAVGTVGSTFYETTEGLRIGGSTREDVIKAWGKPSSVKHRSSPRGAYDVLQYDRGILMYVRGETVFQIVVFTVGSPPPISLRTFEAARRANID